jgi:hypothetical protein
MIFQKIQFNVLHHQNQKITDIHIGLNYNNLINKSKNENMKQLSNVDLNELAAFCGAVEKLCKKDFAHIQNIDAVKRILAIAESTYQKADNILTERESLIYKQ